MQGISYSCAIKIKWIHIHHKSSKSKPSSIILLCIIQFYSISIFWPNIVLPGHIPLMCFFSPFHEEKKNSSEMWLDMDSLALRESLLTSPRKTLFTFHWFLSHKIMNKRYKHITQAVCGKATALLSAVEAVSSYNVFVWLWWDTGRHLRLNLPLQWHS